MHRATGSTTSTRAYVGGGARSVVHEVDDKKEMQEGKGNFLKGETREGIESPQNYGFTSVTMDGDKDKDGNLTDGPETFVSFMGGNRSFPVNGPIDDRRHRLKELEKGDVAMFRTKDDQQQFHLTGDGGFWSAPEDKTVRMQLVKKKQQQQQQGAQAGTHDATSGGSTGGTAGGQQGQQQSERGQKAVRKDSTHRYIDVTKDNTNVAGTNTLLRLDDGKGYVHCSADKKVWVGMEKGKANFARLLTEEGPSVNSYGNLGSGSLREAPGTMDFPPPEIPERCFYTETTWHDAHTSADAWDDFHGNHGLMLDPHTPAPFKFIRSETTGENPGAMVKGSLGLNGADGILSWLNSSGGIEHAALRNIASVPGLLALMQFVRVLPIQTSQTWTKDTRTKHALVFLWGASAGTGFEDLSDGGDGGTTSFGSYFSASGGTHAQISNPDVPDVPGSNGNGSGGDINLSGCGAQSATGSTSGSGGLAIKFMDVTGIDNVPVTIGPAGAPGASGRPGGAGGALIFEMT